MAERDISPGVERHGFEPVRTTDGHDSEERCPDVVYERRRPEAEAQRSGTLLDGPVQQSDL